MLKALFHLNIAIMLFSTTCIGLANNPIHAILFVLASFLSNVFTLFIFNLDFIALIILIIYVGAILVLFLFILMVINIKYVEYKTTTYSFLGVSIIFFLLLELFYLFQIVNNDIMLDNFTKISNYFNFAEVSKLEQSEKSTLAVVLGILLFTENPYWLISLGFILFITTLASILLAHKKKGIRFMHTQILGNARTEKSIYRKPTLLHLFIA